MKQKILILLLALTASSGLMSAETYNGTCGDNLTWTLNTDDGVLCEIWFEDAASLERKALLVSANDLGGCAIWALGFQDDTVWDVLSQTLSLTQEEASARIKKLEEQDLAAAAGSAEAATQTEADTEAEDGPQAAA